MKTAIVIGASGQDGSYMVDYLLPLGYRVIATVKSETQSYLMKLTREGLEVRVLDLTCDSREIAYLLKETQPDEIYNLAAQTFQQNSWVHPSYTIEINTVFVMKLLEEVKNHSPKTRIFQPSAAGMFGVETGPCNEETPFTPQTPYDISKQASHQLCKMYRDAGVFVSTGILFSHESPRRGVEMVSRKISMAVANWAAGRSSYPLMLGNLDFKKDWGYAPQFVEAMHSMLQLKEPSDYVLGTGELHSGEDFFKEALNVATLSYYHHKEKVIINANVKRKHAFEGYADTAKAEKYFGWNSKQYSFEHLVQTMVENDMRLQGVKVITEV